MALQYCAHGQARQRNNHDKQRQDSIKGGCMAGSAAERPTAASRVTSVAAVSVAGWSLRARSRICRRCPPPGGGSHQAMHGIGVGVVGWQGKRRED